MVCTSLDNLLRSLFYFLDDDSYPQSVFVNVATLDKIDVLASIICCNTKKPLICGQDPKGATSAINDPI